MKSYEEFCLGKIPRATDCGFEVGELPSCLIPFQEKAVRISLRRGRSAMFEECGLGKTVQQLAWAHEVVRHTGGKVLILAPLAVSQQTIREGKKFNLPCSYAVNQNEAVGPVTITNYERLSGFDSSQFSGVVLDESSILKNYIGKTKEAIVSAFANTPYRLACSATPAPNDYLELGNHSEFLGIMHSHQMIARWFINNTMLFGSYRLKAHAVTDFWDWVSSWALMASKPSDISPDFDDSRFALPAMRIIKRRIESDMTIGRADGELIHMPRLTATSVHKERRLTVSERSAAVAEIVAREPSESWLLWADTDYEADSLAEAIPEAVNVGGSDSLEKKESGLLGFVVGNPRILITKPKVAGLGMNFQHCARMAFVASTFSFEAWYQAVRRIWRYGQLRPVDVYMIYGAAEDEVMNVLESKRNAFTGMQTAMIDAARRRQHKVGSTGDYNPTTTVSIPSWLFDRVEDENA